MDSIPQPKELTALMKKARTAIPRSVKDLVLSEFNHRCAICGESRPQLHHIDENPGNNDPMNLLPLCPNCHLSDQHNPTQRIDKGILAVFRKFKDPTFLTPQFVPLFRRLDLIFSIKNMPVIPGAENLLKPYDELVDRLFEFLSELEMGAYYAKEIRRYFHVAVRPNDHDHALPTLVSAKIKHEIYQSVSELLRYQEWRVGPKEKRRD